MTTHVMCKVIRPITNSTICVFIPVDIGTDPFDCAQWIGEEFDWQFIPLEYNFVTSQKEIEKWIMKLCGDNYWYD